MPLLFPRRLARRDDADDVAFRPVAVHDHEYTQNAAQAKENEALFLVGVIGIVDQTSSFVRKDGLRLLEGHAMLLLVRARLGGVPLET